MPDQCTTKISGDFQLEAYKVPRKTWVGESAAETAGSGCEGVNHNTLWLALWVSLQAFRFKNVLAAGREVHDSSCYRLRMSHAKFTDKR